MIKFAKTEIKKIGRIRKTLKPLQRKRESLKSRSLDTTEEYSTTITQIQALEKDLNYPYTTPRYFYLAYAVIREKDWRSLEKYPDRINEKEIERVIGLMTAKFEAKDLPND
jgi:hypothetical protein